MKQKGSAAKEERKEVGRRLYYFVKHHLAEKKIHDFPGESKPTSTIDKLINEICIPMPTNDQEY